MCDFPRCSAAPDLTYVGRELCRKHWGQLCEAETPEQEDVLLERIGLIRIQGEVHKRTQARLADRQALDRSTHL